MAEGTQKLVEKAPLTAALKEKLQIEEARLQAEMAQYREFYEQHVNDPKFLEAKQKIKEISAMLGPVQNELAALARAKGSKGIRAENGRFDHKEN